MSKLLKKLEKKLQNCQKCGLGKTRTNLVFGEGSSQADLMFIGEGPGQREDELGKPFVGAAGKLLDEMLESIDLTREEVYIANVVKCRPPGNRDPLPDEVKACWPYLEQQLKEIKPKLIILLGRHSLERFLPGQKISQAHGQALRRDFPGIGKQVFFVAYHPAAALYQGSLKTTLLEDFKRIPRILEKIEEEGGGKSKKDGKKITGIKNLQEEDKRESERKKEKQGKLFGE
ncbi:MAG: uracil-DNA glycosylase [Patescibacteria group bacterium]|nr:uracil-DNA glycosylase [Patescibacteria group bacterium]